MDGEGVVSKMTLSPTARRPARTTNPSIQSDCQCDCRAPPHLTIRVLRDSDDSPERPAGVPVGVLVCVPSGVPIHQDGTVRGNLVHTQGAFSDLSVRFLCAAVCS